MRFFPNNTPKKTTCYPGLASKTISMRVGGTHTHTHTQHLSFASSRVMFERVFQNDAVTKRKALETHHYVMAPYLKAMAPYTNHMVHRVDPPTPDFVPMERDVAARSGRSHRKSPGELRHWKEKSRLGPVGKSLRSMD